MMTTLLLTCAGKYKHTGYQFEVQRIKIHNDSLCASSGRVSVDQNQFCVPNVDVSNFLNLHSKSNHEEFCLAYVFTYRDFTGGTLGLAWVASASGKDHFLYFRTTVCMSYSCPILIQR